MNRNSAMPCHAMPCCTGMEQVEDEGSAVLIRGFLEVKMSDVDRGTYER